MKNIEDKLDGLEQVLAILVKKISVLESLLIDPKVPVDDLARQMLADIQASVAKMPSGNLVISELDGIRKRLDALSSALENPKPVNLSFKSKGYFAILAILLSTTIASLMALQFSDCKCELNSRTAEKYEAVKKLSPRLTILIDSTFAQDVMPSIDSLQEILRLQNAKSQKSIQTKHRKR